VVGTRISLILGFATGVVATVISVVVGLAGGYFGGWIDDVLSLFTNIFLVLPGLPLAIVLAAFSPQKGPLTIGFVTVITGWSWGARVLRSQTLSMRNRDFVEAAKASGESSMRIIFFEILPNEIAIVAAELLGTIIYAILAETGLEYLGLGDVTTVSWGTMFYWAGNNDAILLGAWWWIIPPGLCIALLGAGLAFINFGIDEIANPRLRKETKPKQLSKKGL
jgi:peptide/nickel transport system permease protein